MNRVTFSVNGEPHSVGCEVRSDVTLLDYLRESTDLRGTKYMCREGGCGACVVAATIRPGAPAQAVNSCLVSVTSCQDWDITTVEAVGNRSQGYHSIQKTLAAHNGTQCGYCSPGWVMAMYSLLKNNKKLTMKEIELSFGSNICRCTGYRPILEAFKTFATDSPTPQNFVDIEDLSICKKSGKTCKSKCIESDWCLVEPHDVQKSDIIEIELQDGKSWSRALTIDDIFEVLDKRGDDSYMLVAGNTSKGPIPFVEYPRVLIDIRNVSELRGYTFDQNLVFGAGCTLTETLEAFDSIAKTQDDFWYLEKLREHLLFVGHIPMRNLATIAGNLMIKHAYRDFQSDIFLLLETIGAYITIVDTCGRRDTVTLEEFLEVDMRSKVILHVLLPPLSRDYKIVSYKMMPRSQNVHAMINAGFLYKLTCAENRVQEARIVFGALSPQFLHATETEKYLVGKKLFTNETLQAALKVLDKELVVEENAPEPSIEYRKNLAMNLFYKGLLSICPNGILADRFSSGGVLMSSTRPVTSGQQIYTTDPSLYPINKNIEKVEALIQCSGEAPYADDVPTMPREVYGAFVLATVPLGDIDHIDATEALAYPGVLAFYSAKDIPGENTFIPVDNAIFLAKEEVFCLGPVKYNGQVIGVLVAESRHVAEYAANLVNVKYSNVRIPVLDIKEAKKNTKRVKAEREINSTRVKIRDIEPYRIVKGNITMYSQYHFCMETLVGVTKPTEEGLEIFSTTQHIDGVHYVVSQALNIPANKIDVHVRRLGGAYGEKISRGNQVAVVSALVAHKLNRPCRVALPMTTHMKAVGKRLPCSTDFEISVDKNGKIISCTEDMYMDNGYVVDEALMLPAMDAINNCYDKTGITAKVHSAVTDTPSNTWCRSPGALEAISSIEFMMEQIAYEISVDPLEVRLANLDPAATLLKTLVERLKKESDYTERRAAVNAFNAKNRWKKRGLRFCLMQWKPFAPQYFDVNLSVYHVDGTVSITHAGIEMGQGINTKVVQIAAYLLKIPIDKIQIKGTNTISNPNAFISGGSTTSISISVGVRKCCEELLSRLEPITSVMPNASWQAQIQAAFAEGIDLQTHGFVNKMDISSTAVYGVTLCEVEVDILTGDWEIIRVDLMEDVGRSLSPGIDIGQIEGGFIMGLGYWTCEKIEYEPKTGELLTSRAWTYHVPQAPDIPQDFRVYFGQDAPSDALFYGAKCIGEPSTCMSLVVPFAMREAVVAARLDSGIPTTQWFQIDGPYSKEALQLNTATKYTDFKFY